MTKYAPVSPLLGLHELVKAGLLDDYQLLIAPIVLEHSWAYGKFFHEEHADQFVILDNGVIELGYPLDAVDLAKAARTVNASLIVLPDTIDDGRYTAKQARHAIPALRRFTEIEVMGVVQGKTFEECIECARSLVSTGVDWLAVPRGLTPNLGSRVPLVLTLATEFGLPMHILGFSDNLMDDISAATCHRLVRGIDAATPMWMTERLPPRPPADPRYSLSLGRRPEGFWRSVPPDVAPANVATVRAWLIAAQRARIAGEGLSGQTDLSTAP